MDSKRIIEVKGLTKRYKDLTAVNNLDLNVYEGDVLGFLGPNGAGKSTTIRMLVSLIKPTKGKIKIFGKELTKNRSEILSKIGAIVESPDFYLYLSAYKNLEILGKLSGADISKENIFKVLEIVGLKERYKSKVKTYSHGMKQRLGIAQALLHDPQLIILDEPTTGLDPQGIKDIRELIITLSKDHNKTIFLSSHILKEIEVVSNRMIIINKGTTKVEGTVAELLNSDSYQVAFEFRDIENGLKIITESQWKERLEKQEVNKLVFSLDHEEIADLNKFLNDKDVAVCGIVPTKSLEEYFLRITQETE